MDVLITSIIGSITLALVASSVAGGLAQRCGQPRVVGQLLVGILLGPALLGRLPGHLTNRIFPPAAVPYLTAFAQVAVVIFMFGVGYELDRELLRGRLRAVPLVAVGSLLVPMALGCGAALIFRSGFGALGESHLSRSFVLFMGVAVSVTALPVLAAISRERGLAGTPAGATAAAAAGIMDVAAWLLLAVALVGSGHHRGRPWPVTLLLICCFVAVMLLGVRPLLGWWIRQPRSLLSNPLPIALTLALGSAWVTALLGVHPVLGGFLAGLTMPRLDGTPDSEILRPLEEVGALLLPLFFVVTGLSLNIGALNGTGIAMLALVCAIAMTGKLCPAYLASRISGLPPRDAATVAALVNTRGLTELIALNVGLSAGLLGPQLFSVLVFMAVITTAVTGPLLTLIRPLTVAPAAGERSPVMLPPPGTGEP